MKKLHAGLIAISLVLLSTTVSAAPMGYHMSWEGKRGYSLAGMFSHSGSPVVVKPGHLLTFGFEAFHRGEKIGEWSGAPDVFRYIAGASFIDTIYQEWNHKGDKIGFACYFTKCGLSVNNEWIGASKKWLSNIAVTPKNMEVALPEPASLALILAGLAAFGFRRVVRT